jgi:TonB family protein
MTSAPAESRPWSRRRWWGMVGLIFGVQLALILWLGDTSPVRPRPAAPALTLKLAGSASAELLALRDPTLFALPRQQRVSTPAWLTTPRPEPHPFAWPERTNYPPLTIDQPGVAFNRFVETNAFNPLPPPANPLPALTLPGLPPLAISAEHSTLQLEGSLARRRLLTPLELRSWQNPDILTNSVVQVVVDTEGRPRSVTLLSGSGLKAADQQALELASGVRFEPLGRTPAGTALTPTGQLGWGRMIFRWHTLPLRPTNGPAASP